MKDFAFNNLIVDFNREKYSHNENKDIRRKFYSSLNYNEKLIKVFGKILNKISSNTDNQNLDLLIVKAKGYEVLKNELKNRIEDDIRNKINTMKILLKIKNFPF
ncbi:CRASP family complement regulator-acquiring lipoprotein [Borreliella garinii]|uniref:CRASP family complement regulator-acquiring lipoprotein n=1 Tax=Borreliella garinii TaxID=29519 RepID=UPI001F351BE3|nr:CRASP family complement regulator-acquiring lipoprotein [Borreliella garinii]